MNDRDIALPQDQSPILSQDLTNTTIPQDQNPTFSPTDTLPTSLLILILSVLVQSLVLLNPKSILLFLLAHLEPKSTKDALADPSWYFAMQFEYDALIRNVVWTLIDLPANMFETYHKVC